LKSQPLETLLFLSKRHVGVDQHQLGREFLQGLRQSFTQLGFHLSLVFENPKGLDHDLNLLEAWPQVFGFQKYPGIRTQQIGSSLANLGLVVIGQFHIDLQG
jgi:hypothetical protein